MAVMIRLSNGYEFEFCCASGALGFDGRGYFWERPWHWLGRLRHPKMAVITKSLTFDARKGNLKWWCPWRCVRLVEDGFVNAVGLTNPGFGWWLRKVAPRLNHPTIVSIVAETMSTLKSMLERLNKLSYPVVGVELNMSCPNTQEMEYGDVYNYALYASSWSRHPVIVKLSALHPCASICKELDGKIAAVDLINTIPWTELWTIEPSPLAKYGLLGGVSGLPIAQHAREALTSVTRAEVSMPIISGGGVYDREEAEERFALGADAVAFGSIYIRKPWLPYQIVEQWSKERLHGD